MKKRGFTLASGIIEVVVASLYLLAAFLLIAGIALLAPMIEVIVQEVFAGTPLEWLGQMFVTFVIILGVIVGAFGVLFMIFGVKTIKYAGLPNAEYKTKKGFIITFIVFEFIMLGIILGGLSMGFMWSDMIAITIWTIIPVFKIIDLATEDRKQQQPAAPVVNVINQNNNTVNNTNEYKDPFAK